MPALHNPLDHSRLQRAVPLRAAPTNNETAHFALAVVCTPPATGATVVATAPHLAEVRAHGSFDDWRAELTALRPDVKIL
jgi:hypothetical protein